MPITISNRFKYEKGIAGVNFSTHEFKLALMAADFVFNEDTHGTWADVSASELSSGNGYTAGGVVLTVASAWAQDDTDDKASISWEDVLFETTDTDWPGTKAALIYSNTHADLVVLGCIPFDDNIVVTTDAPLELYNLIFNSL